jgi:hypothetical protein
VSSAVPRYLVERTFATGFPIDATEEGRAACGRIAASNAELGVTWLHSYVTEDGRTSFCLCDAPSPEALRRAAGRNHWPVDAISQVTVLDPHFHLGVRT